MRESITQTILKVYLIYKLLYTRNSKVVFEELFPEAGNDKFKLQFLKLHNLFIAVIIARMILKQ